MNKRFDEWNTLKKALQWTLRKGFKNREIYMTSIGENVGHEQCGMGKNFLRPVVILKRLGDRTFLAVPLTKTDKDGSFYFRFTFKNEVSTALLTQVRLLDVQRLEYKMGKMSTSDFEKLRHKIKDLI